jgi:hypothetical protein
MGNSYIIRYKAALEDFAPTDANSQLKFSVRNIHDTEIYTIMNSTSIFFTLSQIPWPVLEIF